LLFSVEVAMDSVGTPPERQGPDLGRAQWLDATAGAVADASRYGARNGASAASSSSEDS
jgi:hypothetical protein